MQNIPSNTFREVLCEMMAQHLSLEYGETVGKLGPLDFTSRLMQGLFLDEPTTGTIPSPNSINTLKVLIWVENLLPAWLNIAL